MAREALAPFDRSSAESPYQVQKDLQDTMQDPVGIVHTESEMREAGEDRWFQKAGEKTAVSGNREYNPGGTLRLI